VQKILLNFIVTQTHWVVWCDFDATIGYEISSNFLFC